MKYYVILLVTYDDNRADKVGIYSYDTEAEAIKNFHVYMGQYVNAEHVSTVCVEAKNNVGGIYKNEAWTAPEPTPVEPEVVEEIPVEE